MSISYELLAKDGQARRGVVHTAHGDIQTPAFMPVGTAATVKGLLPEMVKQTNADIVLGNTYHLMLRPGADRVEELGGLRKFMQWDRPVLTDSGGFQVMSLSKLRKITEEGVEFQSHIDGKKIMLTPEESIGIQHKLGATITMAFDECTPFPATEEEARASMELSMRWAERSKAAYVPREGHALFGIVQGGVYPHLREESARRLVEIGFDGYAIGGLAVGEGQDLMLETIEATVPHLPEDKPRYLMGVGTPSDLTEAVKRGIDMFDCVIPTRAGRFGRGYTTEGEINIKNAKFADDPRPVDPELDIPQLHGFSRAYVNHLFKADEMLGPMLLSWHNIFFYQHHMKSMRDAIEKA